MTNFIVTCLLLIPWIVVPISGLTEQWRAPKAAFFDFMCMGIICIALIRGIKFQYKNKYLAWLAAWILATVLLSWHIPLVKSVAPRMVFNIWTIEPTLHFILGLIATFICISTLEGHDFIRIAKALCWSAVAVSVVSILQVLGLNTFHGVLNYIGSTKPTAFLDNPMLVANYLCLTVPLFLYFNRLKYYIGLALTLIALWLCDSDMSLIAAGIGVLAFLLLIFRTLRFRLWLYLIATGGVVWVSRNIASLNLFERFAGRIEIWEKAWVHFKTSPMFGLGLGKFKTLGITLVDKTRNAYWLEAHNDWYERLIDLGFLGMFLFVLVLINSFRGFDYSKDNNLGFAYFGVFLSFLVLMFGAFPMEVAPLCLTGLISFWAVEKSKKGE